MAVDALLRQPVRNLGAAAVAAVAADAEETQTVVKTDANGNVNGKQRNEKAAAADVNGIAACAEAFAVYSAVAVAATADN